MNTLMLQQAQMRSDAELVELCLRGNREAFAFIVERYQNLLCGLAFSLCGDQGRSEDLAQETFLVAWRKLSELQSPEKLKSWLCGILRNLNQNSARAQHRDPLTEAAGLEDELTSISNDAAPSNQAMTNEEKALLWKVIQDLPEIYREPLILFYRSDESTAEVADALDLTEEAVRQRLARGRALLGQRLTRLVESGLRYSGPAKAFTVAVVAALPAAPASAGVSGTTLGAGNSVTVLTSAGFVAKWAAMAANFVSVPAGLIGLWGHVLNTRSRHERRFIAWASVGLLAWSIALGSFLMVFLRFGTSYAAGEWSGAILLCLAWLAFCAPVDAYAIWMALRQKSIRARNQDHPDLPLETARRGFKLTMYGAMTALAFGTSGWLMLLAAREGDLFIFLLLLLAAIGSSLSCATWAVRRPNARAQAFILLWWVLGGINIATVGLRWTHWIGTEASGTISSSPLLLIIGVFFGSIRTGWFLKQRLLNSTSVKRHSLIAVALFAVVMLLGFAIYRVATQWDLADIKAVQVMVNEVQADGSIQFRSLDLTANDSGSELRELRFVSSDSAPIHRLYDSQGRQLEFIMRHEGGTLSYIAPLKNPVPPGGSIFLRAEGNFKHRIRTLPNGVSEFRQEHWPANGVPTLRIEKYRLPPGTKLLKANFPNLVSRRLPDNRLEIRIEKLIPPGGNIQFHLQFDAAIGDLKASLDRLQVLTQEQMELLAIIQRTRPQIVTVRPRVAVAQVNGRKSCAYTSTTKPGLKPLCDSVGYPLGLAITRVSSTT